MELDAALDFMRERHHGVLTTSKRRREDPSLGHRLTRQDEEPPA